MPRLTILIDDDTREDLRELAVQKKTTMSALARFALDKTFEDDLDLIAAQRALDEAARDPGTMMSLQEYMAGRKEKARD